jgi:hypothetical protein
MVADIVTEGIADIAILVPWVKATRACEARRPWGEPQRGRGGFRRHHRADNAWAAAVVLLVVGRGYRGIDLSALPADLQLSPTPRAV